LTGGVEEEEVVIFVVVEVDSAVVTGGAEDVAFGAAVVDAIVSIEIPLADVSAVLVPD
jgi:hypothetical protein